MGNTIESEAGDIIESAALFYYYSSRPYFIPTRYKQRTHTPTAATSAEELARLLLILDALGAILLDHLLVDDHPRSEALAVGLHLLRLLLARARVLDGLG